MSRHIVYEEDDFVVEVSMSEDGLPCLHFDIEPECWCVSKYKDLLVIFEQILQGFKTKGFDAVFSVVPFDEKIEKFQGMFGMVEIGELPIGKVYKRDI